MKRILWALLLALALTMASPAEATRRYIQNLKVDDLQVQGIPVFSVEAYGAKCDNTTDDSTAIQAAIDAAEAATGGLVYFPPYKLCYIATGLTARTQVSFEFGPEGGLRTDQAIDMITIDTAGGNAQSPTRYRNIFLDGDNVATAGLILTWQNGAEIEDFEAQEIAGYGLVFDATQNSFIREARVYNSTHGFLIANGCGHLAFYSPGVANMDGYDIDIRDDPTLPTMATVADSGTATGGDADTLVDSGGGWTTNEWTDYLLVNTGDDPDSWCRIASNTSTDVECRGGGLYGGSDNSFSASETYEIRNPTTNLARNQYIAMYNGIFESNDGTNGDTSAYRFWNASQSWFSNTLFSGGATGVHSEVVNVGADSANVLFEGGNIQVPTGDTGVEAVNTAGDTIIFLFVRFANTTEPAMISSGETIVFGAHDSHANEYTDNGTGGDVLRWIDFEGDTGMTLQEDLHFEGSTRDTNEITISAEDPGADVAITLPAADGTIGIVGIGAFPPSTCEARADMWFDTDETDDTNCTTTADNSLCICVATDTWASTE